MRIGKYSRQGSPECFWGAYPVDHVSMRGETMNRTFFLVLGAFVVAGMMAVPAQATYIYDSVTNGVIFSDNFEFNRWEPWAPDSAPTGSWSSYAGGTSTVNVVNAASGGFAAYDGSKYLRSTGPTPNVYGWHTGRGPEQG